MRIFIVEIRLCRWSLKFSTKPLLSVALAGLRQVAIESSVDGIGA